MWLTPALFAYVATIFVVDINWLQVLTNTFWPHLSSDSKYITTVVAVFGTTISPYLFFWQASQEVEDEVADPKADPLKHYPNQAPSNLNRINVDTSIGMAFSNLAAFFIILTTAVTLHANGITDIQTSAQAASALRPIAGEFAFYLFSAGIIGTGLLAIPILAGSAAYGIAGAFDWKNSLELKPKMAKAFYGVIAGATIIGIILCFTPIDPIKALFWSAVINGVISVPIMIVMMLMAVKTEIMGQFTISRWLTILGWGCTVTMMLAVGAMFWTMIK
jgi:Mn2+/Fe2+ NRAMP family transporter